MAENSMTLYWRELIAEGMEKLPRDETGHVKTDALVQYGYDNGRFNDEKLKKNHVKRKIRECCAHGSHISGQLVLGNIKPFLIELDRLILSRDGKSLIELERASTLDIIADTERSANNRLRVDARDDQKRFQQLAFSGWATKELEAARPSMEVTFGNFARESGCLHPVDDPDISDAPPDEDDDVDLLDNGEEE